MMSNGISMTLQTSNYKSPKNLQSQIKKKQQEQGKWAAEMNASVRILWSSEYFCQTKNV